MGRRAYPHGFLPGPIRAWTPVSRMRWWSFFKSSFTASRVIARCAHLPGACRRPFAHEVPGGGSCVGPRTDPFPPFNELLQTSLSRSQAAVRFTHRGAPCDGFDQHPLPSMFAQSHAIADVPMPGRFCQRPAHRIVNVVPAAEPRRSSGPPMPSGAPASPFALQWDRPAVTP